MTDSETQYAEAAEYVIGLMSDAERKAFVDQLNGSPELARIVVEWEDRLAPFDAAYHPETPPTRVKDAIDMRLFGQEKARKTWWRGISVWSGAVVAAAIIAVFVGFGLSPDAPEYIARLDAVETGYAFEATFDQDDRGLTVTVLEARAPTDRDFEVWAIGETGVPVSLGVLPPNGQIEVQGNVLISEGVTLAISLEPPGGSPTGAPTGPVLSAGVFKDV
ncbi:anti-sigma factor [uncultured Roseobacter sp.]|uniref:anti-sigma factor n=1 Tax=uncultured Roseobacter sp. TaxID=114847 RepID=UPI00261EA5D9|nr:anti-sigma factor [uncultured Roseobacter sp.]